MGRRGKGKSSCSLYASCSLHFFEPLTFFVPSLCGQHAALILALMNNAALLSNIIFPLRLSQHLTNVREALPCHERWWGLAGFTKHAAPLCITGCMLLADVIFILQWLIQWDCRILEFLLISSFPHSRVSGHCWTDILVLATGFGGLLLPLLSRTGLFFLVLTPALLVLLEIRVWEYDWNKAHTD